MLSPYTQILVVDALVAVFEGAGKVKTAEEELEAAGAVLALALLGVCSWCCGTIRGDCCCGTIRGDGIIRGDCIWHIMLADTDADITFEAASQTKGLLVVIT
jgi:hypothetical protein